MPADHKKERVMSEFAPGKGEHRAKKSMGQNFLVDPTVCPRIAEKARVDGMGVIEIGPGFGALTTELAKRAAKVVAIELDSDVIPRLKENLAEFDNVTVIEGDALKMDLASVIAGHFEGMRVAAAGNIPYNITSPLIMKLIGTGLGLESVTVMIQKEPALRFCSRPGTDGCGAISAAVWYYGTPSRLFDVSPGAFRPRPKVDSSVIRIEMNEVPPVEVADESFFFEVVRAAFGQRRKTAVNAISSLMHIERGAVAAAMENCGMETGMRAERMDISQFASLANELLVLRNTNVTEK